MIGIWDASLWDSATWNDGSVVVVDDTHDGDFLGRKILRERQETEERRRKVIALYERIVEGKEPAPEPVLDAIEAVGVETRSDIVEAPAIDLGRILAGLERALELQQRFALEADDEEVLLLL